MKIKVYDVEVETGQDGGINGVYIGIEQERTQGFLPLAGIRFLIAALTQMLAEVK